MWYGVRGCGRVVRSSKNRYAEKKINWMWSFIWRQHSRLSTTSVRERASELPQTGCILISKTVGFVLPCSKGHLVFHPCLIRRMSEMTIEQTWWHCFNRTVIFYTIVRSVVFKKRGIVRIHSDLASTLPTSRPLPYPSAFQKLGAQTGISNINTCHVLYTGTALKANLSAFLAQRKLYSDLHEDKANFIIIIIIVDVLSSCL